MAAAPQLTPPVVPFRFPIRASALAAYGSAAARRRPLRATDDVSNEHPTILVVEPDERSRSLLLAGLTREGFDVLAAASLEEAMRYLQPDRALPSMIFCEADLRSGDGFSLCQQVRSEQRTSDLPVVLLSHTPESYHRELAGGVGADQYLPKPLYLKDVVALAKLMAGSSSTSARFVCDTTRVPIAQALRALLSGVRAGRIELTGSKAWIAFREGRVVDASADGLRAEDALVRVLLFAHGEYSVTFGPALTRATMTFGIEDLCRRMMPRIRRWRALLARSVPLEAELVVDFAQLKQVIAELPDDVNRVLRLFDGYRSVRDVVLETGLDEVIALEVVTRLYAMAVLTTARAENEPRTVIDAPSFFEPASVATSTQVAELERTLFGEGAQATAHEPGAELASGAASESPSVASDTAADAQSVFTATGTLDAEMIRQLEAFRIKPVVEPRETPSRTEPASAELEAFASPGAWELAAGFEASETAIEQAVAEQLAGTDEAFASPGAVVSMSAHVVAAGSPTVEDAFFLSGETTADLSPVVQAAPEPRKWAVPVIAVGAVAVVAMVVAVLALTPSRTGAEVQKAATPVTPAPIQVASPQKVAPAVSATAVPSVASVDAVGAPQTTPAATVSEPAFTEVEFSQSAATAVAEATRLYEARKYREAIALLEEVTAADPTVAQAWLLMGLAKYDRADGRGAERAAMQALNLDPTNGRALILLASIYLEQGQEAKARVELKRYLELHPKGPFAAEARELLGP